MNVYFGTDSVYNVASQSECTRRNKNNNHKKNLSVKFYVLILAKRLLSREQTVDKGLVLITLTVEFIMKTNLGNISVIAVAFLDYNMKAAGLPRFQILLGKV